ncbi:head-tail adaptor protein [Maritimibacter sp. DP1N21-5]|uniref:head-tail adaptor protein n=1 Tax=Maritimibacter sp. DP1N21-5 TaxID=2836867 RepID=UPI001C489DFE|nr:head-tail adaptor protein [Maritimibacter sp. DP1N21-5]MBV7408201.1 hypothetical protein [Maritimibacter sp. DP1N21-5]
MRALPAQLRLMGVGIGNLDRRVAVYRYSAAGGAGLVAETRNALNEAIQPEPAAAVPTAAPFVEAWAAREDMSDKERLADGVQLAGLQTRWLVASTPKTRTIAANDVMVADGATWNITGVKESLRGGRHRLLEITTVEMV